MTALVKQRDLVLYRDPRFHAAFPSIAPVAGGGFALAFRRARDPRWIYGREMTPGDPDFDRVDHLDSRSHIAMLTLDADLAPLTAIEALPADPEAGDQDASLLALSDGRLMQHGFLWYPVPAGEAEAVRAVYPYLQGKVETTGVLYLPWGSYVRFRPADGGPWGERIMLPPVPGLGDVVPGRRPLAGGCARGRALELADGALLIASYFGHGQARMANASYLSRSDDGGASWRHVGRIALDASGAVGYCEPALLDLGAGRLLAFHRSIGLDDRLVTSRSDDGGASWGPPRVHDVIGQPCDPLPHADGRVLLVYGHRHPPLGIRARLIEPEAEDFGAFPEHIIRDDGPSRDLGYPWAVELSGGRAGVVYYFTDPAGIRHIAASVLELRG